MGTKETGTGKCMMKGHVEVNHIFDIHAMFQTRQESVVHTVIPPGRDRVHAVKPLA